MDGQGVARHLRDLIKGMRDGGTAAVDSNLLIDYLDKIANDPEARVQPKDETLLTLNVQADEARKMRVHAWDLEMFRSVLTSGTNATRALLGLNGAAAIAMLAFVGHLATSGNADPYVFGGTLRLFAFGALSAVTLTAVTYITQYCYSQKGKAWERVGISFHVLALAAAACSLGLFVWGALDANLAFEQLSTLPAVNPAPAN